MNQTENSSPVFPATSLPAAATSLPEQSRKLIAPAWHTLLLVVVLLGFSFASAGSQADFVSEQGRMTMYLTTLGWEWALTLYVIWGLRKSGVKLGEIVGGRWKDPMDALMDVVVAGGFWLASALALVGMAKLLGLAEPQNIEAARDQVSFLFPQSGMEIAMWFALSATAGFCEEIIFRGYLQTQLARLSGAVWAGILGQGVVFGLAHAYEGWERMIIIGVWGSMFGALVLLRRGNLRSGMMAHGFHNFFVGIVGRVLLK